MPKPQYAGPWKRVRRHVLERDGHLCQIKGPNCKVRGTEVDHIVPVEQGGAWFDLINLRAACQTCNVGRSNTSRREAWRYSTTKITLVYGPPGAGKSTYVQEKAGPADLVVDYDLIGNALGSRDREQHQRIHGAINAARNAVLTQIRRADTGADHVWIISTNPNAPAMFPHHERVLLDPGRDVAYRRASDGGRTEAALALIDEWERKPTSSREW